jgi:hypothetical protein
LYICSRSIVSPNLNSMPTLLYLHPVHSISRLSILYL